MATDLFDVRGKTALITGGSRGIGFALARGLGRSGAHIFLNGRNPATLKQAAENLETEGISCQICPFDVSDHEAVKQAVDGLEAQGHALDILINNAGMQHRQALHEFELDKFDQLIATNLRAVFSVSQAVSQHMIARGAG